MPEILSLRHATLPRCANAIAALAVGLALCGASVMPAEAQVCGDVNSTNTVTAGDALSVLKFAVGQDVALTCSGDCAALDARVTELEDALASTQASLAEVQDLLAGTNSALADVQALLAGVSRTDTAIVISGVNLQVVDGSGATAGPVNGLGNVIVGYNERSFAQGRTGSHNLIVGVEHTYTSFGGIVAGERNTISNRAACVVGGNFNVASGQFASVGGGFSNTSSGQNAAISGGCENSATNTYSAVSGGQSGVASGFWSSVTGGFTNKATADHSSVSGGSTHTAATQFNWRAGSLSEAQ